MSEKIAPFEERPPPPSVEKQPMWYKDVKKLVAERKEAKKKGGEKDGGN